MYHLSFKNSKTNNNPKEWKSDWTGKENINVEKTSFRNEIIETIEKTKAISMREQENLTKVKINKFKRKISQFCKLSYSRILWWYGTRCQ